MRTYAHELCAVAVVSPDDLYITILALWKIDLNII